MRDGTIEVEGRTVGYADSEGDGVAVLWCHGGPGSRLEPAGLAGDAAGLRIVGIDRPGYGLSTPNPGRSIADWVPDGLTVADHLGIDRFVSVGVSTGGAYALALAAGAPERALGVIACCALTDMRWDEGRVLMDRNGMREIWSAPDRDAAIALAVDQFGEDGSKIGTVAGGPSLPDADLALFTDPEWLAGLLSNTQAMFAQGVVGYADDRIADGPGWHSFDVTRVACPVTVLHGDADTLAPVENAPHTAELVPGAELRIVEGLGHFSIVREVVPEITKLLART